MPGKAVKGRVVIDPDTGREKFVVPAPKVDASKKIGREKKAQRGAKAWAKLAPGRVTVMKRGR